MTAAEYAQQQQRVRDAFARAGMGSGRPARKVSSVRIAAAVGILGQLTTEDHEELDDGGIRDEISHVIHALEQIIERKRSTKS